MKYVACSVCYICPHEGGLIIVDRERVNCVSDGEKGDDVVRTELFRQDIFKLATAVSSHANSER